ncbi:MAG TPA: sugar phosphate isomerase/epimerase [Methylomirabilota bacterium]|nr:sugar phosphate isomerase/epimerase [Methylomirabilota bacterium]
MTTKIRKVLAPVFLGALVVWTSPLAAGPIPDEHKIGGMAVGTQAYTFNRFTVFEAIEKTDQAGGRFIEFYPGQRLSPEHRDVSWGHTASDEVIAKVKAKLAQHQIRAVNYGVVQGRDEAEWRKIFEFARKMDLYAITTEDVGKLDIIEALVKEFDIRVGIHEHAKNPRNPDYRLWDPNYVLSLVKDRDPRIGACADTGHWASSGLKPVECLRILRGRIISSHLKDRAAIGSHLPDQVFGLGVSDIKGCLDELKAQGFAGNISIEYENNWDHSVPDVAQCIGFIRGWAASTR